MMVLDALDILCEGYTFERALTIYSELTHAVSTCLPITIADILAGNLILITFLEYKERQKNKIKKYDSYSTKESDGVLLWTCKG